MVWNKGLTKADPRVAKYLEKARKFKKGHRPHLNWYKALEAGKINPPGGWNKNLPPEMQPGYKGGRQKTGNGYIQIKIPDHPSADTRGRVLEHRYLMEQYIGRYLRKDEYIDHINGIKTDNRLENLRLCSKGQNLMNRGAPINNTSGYKNIYFDKKNKNYYVQIGFENKTYNIGTFSELKSALQARNKALKKIHGEFAKLD